MAQFVELPDDVKLDDEPAPAAQAPDAAPADAPAPGYTPEEQQRILEFAKTAKTPEELSAFVAAIGKDRNLGGIMNAKAVIDWRDAHGGEVSPNLVQMQNAAPAEDVPAGYAELPTDAPAETGNMSGMTDDEVRAYVEQLPEEMRPGLNDLIVHGATAGIPTELASIISTVGTGLRHPIEAFQTGGESVADAYHGYRKHNLALLDYARLQHPTLGTAAEIGGAIASPVGKAETLAGMAKGAAQYGLIHGFTTSNGDLDERTTEAMKEAGANAVAAPLFGALLRVPGAAKTLGRTVLGGDESLARRIVTKAITADENTPAEAGRMISEARANNVPMMLADTGENARGTLAAATRSPGPARTIAKTALEERQDQLADRVTTAVERDLGPVANPHEVADTLMTRARDTSAPLYEKAYSVPAIGTPGIERLLDRPSMRKALGKAMRIAKEEGRDPKALGFAVDAEGNVVLHPVNADLFSRQAAARSELTEAQDALKKARTVVGGGGAGDVGAAQERVLSAREELRAADEALTTRQTPGTAETSRQYTMQTLDYVKRGMDDVVESYRDPVTGKLRLDTEGKAINNTLRSFLGQLDKLNPDYAAARAAYGGPVSGVEAMNQGRKALHLTADDLEARIRDMTPFQRQMYALGARRAMVELVASKGDSADTVHALIGTGKKRAMLARLFGDRQGFDRFVQTLHQEREGFQTFRKALLGSPTAPNLADDDALQMATAAAGFVASGGLSIGDAIKAAAKFGIGRAGEHARQQVAAFLSETDPARFRELAQSLRKETVRRGVWNARLNRAAIAAGRGSGTAISDKRRKERAELDQ